MLIGRLSQSSDFARVLKTSARARSAHFAVHFLACLPYQDPNLRNRNDKTELLTMAPYCMGVAVGGRPAIGLWLGSVVPKRHARRAVTRNMLKRVIRYAFTTQASTDEQSGIRMLKGLWIVRLRTAFDCKEFPSASSLSLRCAAAEELSAVLARAASSFVV